MISLLSRTKAEPDPLLAFDHLLVNEAFWRYYQDELEKALTPKLLAIFMSGAEAALKVKPRTRTRTKPATATAPEPGPLSREQLHGIADDAVRSYISPFLQDLTNTTRQGISDAVIAARQDGSGTAGVYERIQQYFDPARAQTIAVTETTRLFGRGSQAVYRAQGYGGWEWHTAMDPWVDGDCAALEGQQFAANQDFDPLHPNCRCWAAPLYDAPEGTLEGVEQGLELESAQQLPPLEESPGLIGDRLWEWMDEAVSQGYSVEQIQAAMSPSVSSFVTVDFVQSRIERARILAEPLPNLGEHIDALFARKAELGHLDEWTIEAAKHGLSLPDYVSKSDARLKELLSDTSVFIQTPQKALAKVLDSGEYKPAHTSGTTGGAAGKGKKFQSYQEKRVEAEAEMFGDKQNPIYGYVEKTPNNGITLSQYGDTAVKLKPSVRSRTTFTQGDSLDTNLLGPRISPSYIESPALRSVNLGDPLAFKNSEEFLSRGSYIEAQIHNGVSVADIEQVTFFGVPDPKLTAKLDERKIPWNVSQ